MEIKKNLARKKNFMQQKKPQTFIIIPKFLPLDYLLGILNQFSRKNFVNIQQAKMVKRLKSTIDIIYIV